MSDEGGMDTAKFGETRYPLRGSQITVPLTSPIRVIIGDQELEIGKPTDLGGLPDDHTWKADCIIIDRKYLTSTNAALGYKGVRDGEAVILGRESAHRFRFGEKVSRVHVGIKREGDILTIKDLNSTNGTTVVVNNPPKS